MTEIEEIVRKAYINSRRKHKGNFEPEIIVTKDATLKAVKELKRREVEQEFKRMRYAEYERAYRKAMRNIRKEVG